MLIKDLLQDISYTLAGDGGGSFVANAANISGTADISGICYDSRKAEAGQLFVCLRSTFSDGHDFALNAYEKGIRAFLCESVPAGIADMNDVLIACTDDTRTALALISARYFDFPAKRLKFIGITGTKGKTTISFMLKSIFEHAGKKIGLIGSNGVFYGDVWYKLPNTTPESYQLHKILYDMAEAGTEYCVLEATSQGFFLHRTYGIHFDLALYTNISPDHISATEHPSFEHYFACKQKIFAQTDLCFVNRDEPLFAEITENAPCEIKTFGAEQDADYFASDIRLERDGNRMLVRFSCRTPDRELSLSIAIPGRFNAYNALAAVCIADRFGIPKEAIKDGLETAVVAGRMESIEVPAPYTVLIDFAHNKLSVEAMMETAKLYEPKRIICVFGLEGNRSHIRRFDSGEILGRTADIIILANASPRTDDPDQILLDIATGVRRSGGTAKIIPDRSEAIPYALSLAKAGDLVLLVGKGNVLYEEVHGINVPFSERAVVETYFAAKVTRSC